MAAKRFMKAHGTEAQKMLNAKLLAYCAMASGALLAAPSAEAAVVYSGVKNLPVNHDSTVAVDLDTNTVNDVQFMAWHFLGAPHHFVKMQPLNNNSLFGGCFGHYGGTLYGGYCFIEAGRLPGGSLAPSQTWTHGAGILNYQYYSFAKAGLFNDQTGYIGVRFYNDGKRYYGWIQYRGSNKYTFPPSATGTIIDWAYESTADTPIKAGQTASDTDGDGILDNIDNCPAVANPQQLDADTDGIGDVCDTTPGCGGCGQAACEAIDTDGDGIQNYVDNCPNTSNPQQKDADADGIGDACDTTPGCGGGCGQPVCEGSADTDGDYVRDAIDNCPSVFNPNQLDANGNGTGDCCDTTPDCGEGQPVCDDFCTL